MRKHGIVPRLQTLPAAQIDALVHWLSEENLTLEQARKRLKAEFGVSTGTSALSNFWHQVCVPRRFAKMREDERLRQEAEVGGKVLLRIEVRTEGQNGLSIVVTGGGAKVAE